MIIEIALLIGCLLDLTLTYNYLKIYRKKFPKKDYIVIEANPLIRQLVRRNGLGWGMIYSGTMIFGIIIVIINFANTELKFFMAGVYYMMITFHLTNFLALKRMKQINIKAKRQNKGGNKQ